jgi:hypothetical protein
MVTGIPLTVVDSGGFLEKKIEVQEGEVINWIYACVSSKKSGNPVRYRETLRGQGRNRYTISY